MRNKFWTGCRGAVAAVFFFGAGAGAGVAPVDYEGVAQRAEAALRAGRVHEAMSLYQNLQYLLPGERGIEAAINLAACQQGLGMDCSAVDTLAAASRRVTDAESATGLNLRLAQANNAMRQRKFKTAGEHLTSALELANKLNDRGVQARVHLSFGMLAGMRKADQAPRDFAARDSRGLTLVELPSAAAETPFGEAKGHFENGMRAAREMGAGELELQGQLNLGKLAVLFGEDAQAEQAIKAAEALLKARPGLDATGAFWVSCGENQLWLRELAVSKSKSAGGEILSGAEYCFEQAAKLAETAQQHSLLSYVRGYQGRLARVAGRAEEAKRRTGQAMFHAQKAQDQMGSFLWQWQTAQLFAAQGNRAEAYDFYKLATDSFKQIRKRVSAVDLMFKFGPLGAEGVFYELAELNFEQADAATEPEQKQKLLLEARQSIEAFKAFQIENQFLSRECAQLLENITGNLETTLRKLERNTAVIYVIPLAARTEVMASMPDGKIERFKITQDRAALNDEAGKLRAALANGPGKSRALEGEPLKSAQKLYDTMIRPLEAALKAQGVEQLVFILDGAMSSIPVGVLHDGKQFLIEKHAVAIAPGLAMVEPGQKRAQQPRLLVGGLTTEETLGKDKWSLLQNVEQEVKNIAGGFANTTLLGDEFTRENVQRVLRDEKISYLHLATHGTFSSSPEDTYVVTRGGRITLDDLESFVRPLVLRETPLEMLVMSACETAKGNSRAAFGLAGVAIKSGARSVVATLWQVDDLAMTELMSAFYRNLATDSKVPKAEALRQAQLALLQSKDHRHPYFWAPCILLGNWL